jgi:hypothetical protein
MTPTEQYLQQLLPKLREIKPDTYMNISRRNDVEAFTGLIRHLIDLGEPFVLSEDNNSFKRLELRQHYEQMWPGKQIKFSQPNVWINMQGVPHKVPPMVEIFKSEQCIAAYTLKNYYNG